MSRDEHETSRRIGGPSRVGGRGIVIAHPSPSVRVRLAMGLLDERPVFMANGPVGLLRQLEAVASGVVRAPEALVLGELELTAFRESALWVTITRRPMTLVLIARRPRPVARVDAVYRHAPRIEEVRALLAA